MALACRRQTWPQRECSHERECHAQHIAFDILAPSLLLLATLSTPHLSNLMHALSHPPHLTTTCALGRQLQQTSDVTGAYVQVQIAILTSGNMASGLQLQLIASVAGPLLAALQQSGLPVTSISLDSLNVEEVRTSWSKHVLSEAHFKGDSSRSLCSKIIQSLLHHLQLLAWANWPLLLFAISRELM